jgi:RNA polymerase sigma-70 factor (ECF subfamily)
VDRAERAELQHWMTLLADGDRSAFHPVFARLWPLVRGFVSRQVARELGPAEAEDVAQLALLKLFERATEFNPQLDALSWALGVAAYEARSARRRAGRRREDVVPLDALADDRPTPEEHALCADLESAASALIGTLRPADAEALAALASGRRPAVPGATFRKRLERAMARVRAAWKAKHGS